VVRIAHDVIYRETDAGAVGVGRQINVSTQLPAAVRTDPGSQVRNTSVGGICSAERSAPSCGLRSRRRPEANPFRKASTPLRTTR